MTQELLKTPLHALHVEVGAKMVPFAGYDILGSIPSRRKEGTLTHS